MIQLDKICTCNYSKHTNVMVNIYNQNLLYKMKFYNCFHQVMNTAKYSCSRNDEKTENVLFCHDTTNMTLCIKKNHEFHLDDKVLKVE